MNQPQPGLTRVVCAWSPQDEQVLRERYRLDGAQVLAERFGRSPGSIRTKANAMGLSSNLRSAARSAPATPAPAQPKQVATPVLNARVSAKAKSEKKDTSAIGKMLEQMRALPGGHPRRLAYAQAARTGTGQDAYQAWKNWTPTNAA